MNTLESCFFLSLWKYYPFIIVELNCELCWWIVCAKLCLSQKNDSKDNAAWKKFPDLGDCVCISWQLSISKNEKPSSSSYVSNDNNNYSDSVENIRLTGFHVNLIKRRGEARR